MPPFERGAEARSESCLLVENDSRLLGDGPIELGSTDQAEIDKGLSQALTRLGLSIQCVVDIGAVDSTLCNEQ